MRPGAVALGGAQGPQGFCGRRVPDDVSFVWDVQVVNAYSRMRVVELNKCANALEAPSQKAPTGWIFKPANMAFKRYVRL